MHSRKLRPSHLWDVESACSIRELASVAAKRRFAATNKLSRRCFSCVSLN